MARRTPGKARFQGKGMGGGAAASSRTRTITEARKPEDGTSSPSVERMRLIGSRSAPDLGSVFRVGSIFALGSVFMLVSVDRGREFIGLVPFLHPKWALIESARMEFARMRAAAGDA